MCPGVGRYLHRLDPRRTERVGAVPLHPGHHLVPGAARLRCLCPGGVLETDQRTGNTTLISSIYISPLRYYFSLYLGYRFFFGLQ